MIFQNKRSYPLHNKINDHDDGTEKLITKAIFNRSNKVKSGQGGICTVVTELSISQQLGDQLS